MIKLGVSSFYRNYSIIQKGNSYTTLNETQLIEQVQKHWSERIPGTGEGNNIDRKVLVPLQQTKEPVFFCPPTIPLQLNLPVQAKVLQRQAGEDPYVKTFVSIKDAYNWGFQPKPAMTIHVVCYSAEALLENGGSRTTDMDWEIVTLLCSTETNVEPMPPLTMARNFLQMPGGTYGEYTAEEFAQAIYYHSKKEISVCDID